MTDVADGRSLLVLAVQDLGDAEAAMIERLPRLRGYARDPDLVRIIASDEKRSAFQHHALAAIASELNARLEGPPNIWLRAILDDAENDAETILAGPLLDIALTGALRKGKQAERVSYETAIALAERLEITDAASRLTGIRDAEAATDAALAEVQARICSSM